MSKSLLPDIRFKSAYQLPFEVIRQKGIKILLFDRDNTLLSFYESFIDKKDDLFKLKNEVTKEGFKMILASNGQKRRIEPFANKLGVKAYSMLMKPFGFKIKRIAKKEGVKPDEILLIGDQVMTDLKAAKKAHIYFGLVDKLTDKEPFFTKINRHFEKKFQQEIALMPYDIFVEDLNGREK